MFVCLFFLCRDESEMCMLHAIRQYDGDKMMWPLNKVIESAMFFHNLVVKRDAVFFLFPR